MTGVSNTSPTRYSGTKIGLVPVVTRSRRPLSTDLFNPETGKYYSIATIWQVGKNPSTGTEGEIFMLKSIISNSSNWQEIASASGLVFTVTGSNGVDATPTTGNVIVSGINATTSSVGVASFESTQFAVDLSGEVTLLAPGIIWSNIAGGAFVSAAASGYFINGAATTTLPVISSGRGQTIEYISQVAGLASLVITAQAAQRIRMGDMLSSLGGTLTCNDIGSTVELIYSDSNSTWIAGDNNGSWGLV